VVTRECVFVMCLEHCPGCHVHKKDTENRPKLRKPKEEAAKTVADDSLHRAVKSGSLSPSLWYSFK
jgi:hypothetical protein